MPISSNCVLHDFSDLNVVRKEFCVFRIPQNTAIRSFSKSSTLRISKGAENSILNGTKKLLKIILNREALLTWPLKLYMQVKQLMSSIVVIIILFLLLSTIDIKAIKESLEKWFSPPRLEVRFKYTTRNI